VTKPETRSRYAVIPISVHFQQFWDQRRRCLSILSRRVDKLRWRLWSVELFVDMHLLSHIIKHGIHRHQTPPRSYNAARCSTLRDDKSVHAHTATLPPNMTSSIKPEVHNVAKRHRRRTEPRPQGICTINFVRIGPAVPDIMPADRQTHRQTG